MVQQLEAHVLQPFLMGRFVSVHPLGVIIAIALGVIVAGIPGALIAVPLAASLNAVVQHLANYTEVGEDAEEAAEDEPAPIPVDASGEDVADVHDDETSPASSHLNPRRRPPGRGCNAVLSTLECVVHAMFSVHNSLALDSSNHRDCGSPRLSAPRVAP